MTWAMIEEVQWDFINVTSFKGLLGFYLAHLGGVVREGKLATPYPVRPFSFQGEEVGRGDEVLELKEE